MFSIRLVEDCTEGTARRPINVSHTGTHTGRARHIRVSLKSVLTVRVTNNVVCSIYDLTKGSLGRENSFCFSQVLKTLAF